MMYSVWKLATTKSEVCLSLVPLVSAALLAKGAKRRAAAAAAAAAAAVSWLCHGPLR
jgi:hypothetical protein